MAQNGLEKCLINFNFLLWKCSHSYKIKNYFITGWKSPWIKNSIEHIFFSVLSTAWRHLSHTKTVYRYSVCMWSFLLKRMQMTCIAWLQPLKTCGEKRTDPVKKRGSLSLYNLVRLTNTGSPFVRCFICNKRKVKLCTALRAQNTTANNFHLTRSKHNCTSV